MQVLDLYFFGVRSTGNPASGSALSVRNSISLLPDLAGPSLKRRLSASLQSRGLKPRVTQRSDSTHTPLELLMPSLEVLGWVWRARLLMTGEYTSTVNRHLQFNLTISLTDNRNLFNQIDLKHSTKGVLSGCVGYPPYISTPCFKPVALSYHIHDEILHAALCKAKRFRGSVLRVDPSSIFGRILLVFEELALAHLVFQCICIKICSSHTREYLRFKIGWHTKVTLRVVSARLRLRCANRNLRTVIKQMLGFGPRISCLFL